MFRLTDKQIAEYFQRSYTSVDGLWFMKIEERYDFDTALDIDKNVWKVFPKIQARTMKSLCGLGYGIEALREAIEAKHTIEKYGFEIETTKSGDSFTCLVTECPWFNLMVKSGREHLAHKVGEAICEIEYPVWATEFGDSLRFTMEGKLCSGSKCCIMTFTETKLSKK